MASQAGIKEGTFDKGIHYNGGMPFGDIVSVMRQRRSQDSLLIRQMIEIRDRYNGDIVLPMLQVKDKPVLDPPVARLIAQAVDGTARRAASARPTITCPALDMTIPLQVNRAATRRKALYAGWHREQMDVKNYRAYRHLVGYGTCSWVVMPDEIEKCARIGLRDPLTSYPELRAPDDIRDPVNVGYIYGRSIEWIKSNFPEAYDRGFISSAAGYNWDTLWDMIEWVDEDAVVVGILGPRMPAYQPQDSRPYGYNGFELRRFENKAGMVPACSPRRVTLDRIQGQISTMVGTVDLHAKLTALGVIQAEVSTFPDLVVMGENGMAPEIISNAGQWRRGTSGEANQVSNTKDVKFLANQPGPFVSQTLQNLEMSIRESGGADSLFGGNTNSAARSGRQIETLGGFSIDPGVEEAQKIMQHALTTVNRAVMAVEKGYFSDKKFVCFTGLSGEQSTVEYTPSKDFTNLENAVTYPIPGADVSTSTVAIAQMKGAGMISGQTARIIHPLIDDPDQEGHLIMTEQFEMAMAAALAQQIQQGAVPLTVAADIVGKLRAGEWVETAIVEAQKKAQAQAAAQQTQQPAAPGMQGPSGAPPGQPPGAGPLPPSIPQGPQALTNVHNFFRSLQQPQAPQPTAGPANT